eukprot:196717-Prorocentrum_minimum.AAC.1
MTVGARISGASRFQETGLGCAPITAARRDSGAHQRGGRSRLHARQRRRHRRGPRRRRGGVGRRVGLRGGRLRVAACGGGRLRGGGRRRAVGLGLRHRRVPPVPLLRGGRFGRALLLRRALRRALPSGAFLLRLRRVGAGAPRRFERLGLVRGGVLREG